MLSVYNWHGWMVQSLEHSAKTLALPCNSSLSRHPGCLEHSPEK